MNQILAEGGFAPEWVMLRLPSFFHLFSFLLMQIRILDLHWKKGSGSGSGHKHLFNTYLFSNHFSYKDCFHLFSILLSSVLFVLIRIRILILDPHREKKDLDQIFMQQLDEPFRYKDIFDNLFDILFFNSSVLSFKSKRFFLQFLVDILPFDSDPWICIGGGGGGGRMRLKKDIFP